jgi:hypothetical protein
LLQQKLQILNVSQQAFQFDPRFNFRFASRFNFRLKKNPPKKKSAKKGMLKNVSGAVTWDVIRKEIKDSKFIAGVQAFDPDTIQDKAREKLNGLVL